MKDREHNGQKFEDTKGLKNTMAKYQRVNQKTHIDEGQRTQWPKV